MRVVEINGPSAPMAVKPYRVAQAGSATTSEIVAGVAGKRSSVHYFSLSTDIAGAYSIAIGTEVIWSKTIGTGINGGYFEFKPAPYYIEGDETEADIVLTKPSAANTSVTMFAGLA